MFCFSLEHLAVFQSMTEDVFLTLGQRRSSRFKKLGLQPKVQSFVNFALGTTSTGIKVKLECINYNLLDFCNYLLVTANVPFEKIRVLLW